jgi:hypothetical protein
MSRRGAPIASARSLAVDVGDADAVEGALAGCEVAYYLVHSLEAWRLPFA